MDFLKDDILAIGLCQVRNHDPFNSIITPLYKLAELDAEDREAKRWRSMANEKEVLALNVQ